MIMLTRIRLSSVTGILMIFAKKNIVFCNVFFVLINSSTKSVPALTAVGSCDVCPFYTKSAPAKCIILTKAAVLLTK